MLAPPRGVLFSYSFLVTFFTHGTLYRDIYWISPPSYDLILPCSSLKQINLLQPGLKCIHPFSFFFPCYGPALLTLHREELLLFGPSRKKANWSVRNESLWGSVCMLVPAYLTYEVLCRMTGLLRAHIPYFAHVDPNYFFLVRGMT